MNVTESIAPRLSPAVTTSESRTIRERVAAVSYLFSRRFEECLAGTSISLDQWNVLSHLAQHEGASMSELSTSSNITGPTLTRIVDQLVAAALVFRNVDESDRRRVLVYLSKRGRAQERAVAPQIAEAERRVIGDLTQDEAREVNRLLLRMAHNDY